jgi:hypothetical protein
MKTIVWILFFVSTGVYNSGSVSNFDYEFKTEQACLDFQKKLYDGPDKLWGVADSFCVSLEKEEGE